MEDQLITFETAKLAKEKGFNTESKEIYYIHPKGHQIGTTNEDIFQTLTTKELLNLEKIFKPTQSLLQKWLREEHNLHPDVYRCAIGWEVNLEKAKCGTFIKQITEYEEDTYEEALEKGLQEALKLIK